MNRKLILPIIIIVALAAIIIPQVVEEMRRVRGSAPVSQPSASPQNRSGARQPPGNGQRDDTSDQNEDLTEHAEQRETFQLEPGARLELVNIRGHIEIETTAEGNTAEIHVITSANSRSFLERHRIVFEHSPTNLMVRGESSEFSSIWHTGGGNVRQRVTLRVPRNIEFSANEINGRVRVGEIDGSVEMREIDGTIDIAGARGRADINEVNGRVNVTLRDLGSEHFQVRNINGGVEIRFVGVVNADVHAERNNGSVDIALPNVTMQDRRNRANFRARIGTGGPLIGISRVNGRVRLAPLANES